jgi:hypothetical protein
MIEAINIQQQPSILVPSKLGWATDETHRRRKTETKKKVKKRGGGNKKLKQKKSDKGQIKRKTNIRRQ